MRLLLARLLFRRPLRDAAAPAARRVLVDRAALRRAVEDARRLGDRGLGGLATLLECVARGLHRGARCRASERLDGGAACGLSDPLERRALLLFCGHRSRTIA